MSDISKQDVCATVSNPETPLALEVKDEEPKAQEAPCPKSGNQEKQGSEIKVSQVK